MRQQMTKMEFIYLLRRQFQTPIGLLLSFVLRPRKKCRARVTRDGTPDGTPDGTICTKNSTFYLAISMESIPVKEKVYS